MTRRVTLILPALLLVAGFLSAQPGWKTVPSDGAGCSVDIPLDCPFGDPGSGSPRINTPRGLLAAHQVLICSSESATYSVLYTDLSQELVEFGASDLLLSAVTLPRGFTVVWSRDVTCDGYPGREAMYRLEGRPHDSLRTWKRVCLIESRMYNLGATADESESEAVEYFLDSFRVLWPEPN